MNANSIVPGLEYAYTPWPSKNKSYYPGAKRVRVLFVYKLEPEYGQRRTTLVECLHLDNDTGEILPNMHVATVNARQIISSWEEHEIERHRHEAKREAELERRRKEEEERQAVYQARQAEQQRKINAIKDFVSDSLGINPQDISIGYYRIEISRPVVEDALEREVESGQNIIERTGQESFNSATDNSRI